MNFLCNYKIPFFRLSEANLVKESLTQQSELWKNKFRMIKEEKEAIYEQAGKQKAVMSEMIKTMTNKCSRRDEIIEVTMTT